MYYYNIYFILYNTNIPYSFIYQIKLFAIFQKNIIANLFSSIRRVVKLFEDTFHLETLVIMFSDKKYGPRIQKKNVYSGRF